MRIYAPCFAVMFSFGLSVHLVAQTVKGATSVTGSAFSNEATLRPGDSFEMRLGAVPAETGDAQNFQKVYTVGGDGTINVPFGGLIHAAGLTHRQLEKAVQQKLIDEKIYRWPTITITIPEGGRLIKVGGQQRVAQRTLWPLKLDIHLRDQNEGKTLPIDEMKRRANCAMISPRML